MRHMELAHNRYMQMLAAATFAVFGASFAVIAMNANELSDSVVLGFNEISGITLFGVPHDVWGVWITGIVFTAINLLLTEALGRQNRAAAYALGAVNLLLAVLVLAAIGTIMSVN